jgi:hypothetical protein
MKFVVYTSLAVANGDATTDINAILLSSLRNNSRWDVTGWLHVEHGRFYQVVEGPDAAVTLLMARLRDDRRHYSLVELGGGQISTRLFPDFDMGFASANGCYLWPLKAATPPPGSQDVIDFLRAMSRQRRAAPSTSATVAPGVIRH